LSQASRQSHAAKVVSLPQTRRLSWASVSLEYSHQLVLALWVGALATVGFLATPSLYGSLRDPTEAAWASLDLSMRLNFLAGGAGAFLLLTTLLMYLLALRTSAATFLQMGLLLGMTLAAVVNHVAVAPKMAELLRANPDLMTQVPRSAEVGRYGGLSQISAALLGVQMLLGASLLFLGVRRWYRYVQPQPPEHRTFPRLRFRS
jgi:putative copper export protein